MISASGLLLSSFPEVRFHRTGIFSKYDNIRIYQEKAIGGSVCDLMAVTDRLTGYEIKSDQDNYARIKSQVSNYQKFFLYNYIVVGRKHSASAAEKVPYYWGIVVISDENVQVEREAKEMGGDKWITKNQLSILWKLELNNLLSYFRLPMFSLKGNPYTKQIKSLEEVKSLREQIGDE